MCKIKGIRIALEPHNATYYFRVIDSGGRFFESM
jgi:hypothetical protein